MSVRARDDVHEAVIMVAAFDAGRGFHAQQRFKGKRLLLNRGIAASAGRVLSTVSQGIS